MILTLKILNFEWSLANFPEFWQNFGRIDLLDCMVFMELMDAGAAHNLRTFYL